MANDVNNPRLWVLDTGAVIMAVGYPVIVRKVYYVPNAAADDVVIQEYDYAGSLRSAIVLKAHPTAAEPFEMDFGPDGRQLNGFKLATIDGGTLYVYIGRR